MLTFGLTSCYMVLMFLETHQIVASQPMFYFLGDNGEQINTTDISEVYGIKVSKLVVDFNSLYYVDTIKKASHPSETPSELFTYYFDGLKEYKHLCPWEEKFDCKKTTRMLILKVNGKLTDFKITDRETSLDDYVGCFDRQSVPITTTAPDLDFCKVDCRNYPFHGINPDTKCICVDDMSKLVAVELGLCDETLNTYQIYGGKKHFSVYSKTKVAQPAAYPSWECVYNFENCPKCPNGLTGFNCDVIVCSVNNGNCGIEKKCQNITLWVYITVAVCVCKDGVHMNNDYTCGSKKIKQKDNWEEVSSWSKLAIGFMALFVITLVAIGGTYVYDFRKSGGIFSPRVRSEKASEDEEDSNLES